MGLVTLFRGPRFLVFLYSKLRTLPFLPSSLNFLFQLLERVLEKIEVHVCWRWFFNVIFSPLDLEFPDLISKIRGYTGRGLLIAPYQIGPVLTITFQSFISQPLPEDYFLFQLLKGKMIESRKYHDYGL